MSWEPTYYSAEQSAELVTHIPCGTVNIVANRRAIYEIDLIEGPKAGELFQITALCETTNDLHKLTGNSYSNVSMVFGLILCTTSGQADCVGIEVCEQAGENVTPAMHHGIGVRARNWKPTVDYPEHRYLKLIGYCSSSLTVPGFEMKVMTDYGHLDVVRWTQTV